ncbi:MAG: FkbM family methyltransferase [Nanoarchaeota archaeon]|nr:FkbM family methyltransferase [Nanoarchaeota archaeon]
MLKKKFIIFYNRSRNLLFRGRVKSPLLTWVGKKIIFILKSDYAEIDGDRIYLDTRDSLALSTIGSSEPFIRDLFKKEVKPGEVVVDIGANIGYHTLLLAKLVGDKGKVYAFEPHPENFALLKKNVEVNGYKNVIVEQKAVSDKNGKVKLYLAGDNRTTRHSMIKYEKTKAEYVEVDTVALDDYFKDQSVHFIKIDIEGAEHYAVVGMRKLLKKNKNIKMILEFTPARLEDLGIKPAKHIKLLQELDFTLLNVNEKDKVLDVFEMDKIPVYITKRWTGSDNTNLFCYK